MDWAEETGYLLTECYPDKEELILVMDNLNVHAAASLYKKFPAPLARAYTKRLEIHYTPKHGSWLNIAEIELNVMARQCLPRRLDSVETVSGQLEAWSNDRNSAIAKVNWQFTAENARTKLVSVYPKFENKDGENVGQ